jgi:hypothetical protein
MLQQDIGPLLALSARAGAASCLTQTSCLSSSSTTPAPNPFSGFSCRANFVTHPVWCSRMEPSALQGASEGCCPSKLPSACSGR